MGSQVRQAREDDLERLIAIHANAFADPRSHSARLHNFTRNPLGTLEDLWVLENDDRLVAHAFLFQLHAWFAGVRVPVGGIATVGVAHEARRRGLGSMLIARLHEVARARGDAITLLYPFRQAFYARLGYAPTSSYRRLRLAPAAIRWGHELQVRAAWGSDREAIRSCWDAAGAQRTGTLVRSDRAWQAYLLDERRIWLVAEGPRSLEGYMACTVAQAETHAKTTLVVHEMVFVSDAAMRSLWASIAAQRDQVDEVQVWLAADDPVDWAMIDADRSRFGNAKVEHQFGEVVGGPMVRMVDVASALTARGWRLPGELVLGVGERRLALSVRDGHAEVAETASDPSINVDEVALAAIAFGALPVTHAMRLGWVAARDERALALADALLALPPYFSPDRF